MFQSDTHCMAQQRFRTDLNVLLSTSIEIYQSQINIIVDDQAAISSNTWSFFILFPKENKNSLSCNSEQTRVDISIDLQFKILIVKRMLQHQENNSGKARVIAVLLLALEIGLMFAYGFGTKVATFTSTSVDFSYLFVAYILPAILAILGWGLIIAYSENSAVSGLTTTLIAVGLGVQLFPIFYIFWSDNFNSYAGVYDVTLLIQLVAQVGIVSLMICLCGLSGRLGIVQTVIVIICFTFGWTLNLNFHNWLKATRWTNEIAQLDDGLGSTYTYLFAGIFSLVVSSFLNCKPGENQKQSGSRASAFIGLIGTGFAFATSPYTTTIGLSTVATTAARFEFPLNTYFALTASVITTYCFSAIFGNYKIGVRQSLVGILGGVPIIAAIAPFINNIGGCFTVGTFAGLVSGFWLRYVHPRINATKSYDHLGILGPITINAFIGVAFVGTLLFGAYKNEDEQHAEVSYKISDQRPSTYLLAICGITLAVAVGMGLIAGIICYLTRDPANDFQFTKLVSSDFGLYDQKKEQAQVDQPFHSASHLKNAGDH